MSSDMGNRGSCMLVIFFILLGTFGISKCYFDEYKFNENGGYDTKTTGVVLDKYYNRSKTRLKVKYWVEGKEYTKKGVQVFFEDFQDFNVGDSIILYVNSLKPDSRVALTSTYNVIHDVYENNEK